MYSEVVCYTVTITRHNDKVKTVIQFNFNLFFFGCAIHCSTSDDHIDNYNLCRRLNPFLENVNTLSSLMSVVVYTNENATRILLTFRTSDLTTMSNFMTF